MNFGDGLRFVNWVFNVLSCAFMRFKAQSLDLIEVFCRKARRGGQVAVRPRTEMRQLLLFYVEGFAFGDDFLWNLLCPLLEEWQVFRFFSQFVG